MLTGGGLCCKKSAEVGQGNHRQHRLEVIADDEFDVLIRVFIGTVKLI